MSDTADQKSVNDERARFGRERAVRRTVWATLLGDVQGRQFCWWLLSCGNIYSSTYRGENTHDSAFCEGARALMIPIQGEMIDADPKNYLKMVLEQQAKAMENKDVRTDD